MLIITLWLNALPPQSRKLHVQIRFMEKTMLTSSTVMKEKRKPWKVTILLCKINQNYINLGRSIIK